MSILEAIVLGLVQGLTEFLPVSSSGHLVLARELMAIPADDPAFEVVVHLGTLGSVLLVLRREVLGLLAALPRLLDRSSWRASFGADPGFRALVLLVPATIPTVVVGLAAKDRINALFAAPDFAAAMLLVTAVILFTTRWRRAEPGRSLSLPVALAMGLAQAVAILPGISRSGSTISAGLHTGGDRGEVGGFSFLMAIPAILGALILEAGEIGHSRLGVGPLLFGFLAAALVGSLALVILLRLVRGGRLWVFSGYLVLVSLGWFLFHR